MRVAVVILREFEAIRPDVARGSGHRKAVQYFARIRSALVAILAAGWAVVDEILNFEVRNRQTGVSRLHGEQRSAPAEVS